VVPMLGSLGDADLYFGDKWVPQPGPWPSASNASSATDDIEVVSWSGTDCTAPPCWYFMAVVEFYGQNDVSYTIVVTNGSAPIPLADGVPVNGYVGSNDFDYYSAAFWAGSTQDAYNVALTTLSGDPDVFVLLQPNGEASCGGGGVERTADMRWLFPSSRGVFRGPALT
jgi:hypothetical protein